MSRKAVLVVDVIKDFVDPEGKVPHPQAAAIVPHIEAFVAEARKAGAIVIWIIDAHRPGKPDWELAHVRAHCTDGTRGVELAEPLAALPEDYVIKKRRYSAFMGTDLDLVLRDNGVDTLFITGTKTNVCIRATSQDAFEMNYSVIIPRECVSTDKEHLHVANLEDIDKYMGRVVDLARAIELLRCEGETA
ncbi:MAG TPA: isochorismatase family cysteine hydrolase [Aggregatilinea sp.]|uniref:cysteine hydrolase family protein n=1 Tax=Aggregatilinea sp. TaxID=2806333 RepID=UPI002C684C3A|nr:isochorismatase family cysteine hydrolase [Aggregatilinea sp.]HML20528.1 isochorismatase family cysteine hydrolase [Aggregatilinea sp.]